MNRPYLTDIVLFVALLAVAACVFYATFCMGRMT